MTKVIEIKLAGGKTISVNYECMSYIPYKADDIVCTMVSNEDICDIKPKYV